MADDKVSGGIEPAAAAPSETGANSDKTLIAATFKTVYGIAALYGLTVYGFGE